MSKRMPIFYSASLLTAVNLLLRLIGTGFQVFISGRIGAKGVGLLQLVLSVGMMAMTVGTAGVRTAAMYLTAEELGKHRQGQIPWVLRSCMRYSLFCSIAAGLILYVLSPVIAREWIRDPAAIPALRLLSALLPVGCMTGVLSGYFTSAGKIGTLAAVEAAEQLLSLGATGFLLGYWAGHDSGRICSSMVLGSSFGSCLTLLILSILCRREHLPVSKPLPLSGRLLRTAVPLALADDLRSGISTGENLLVPNRLSLHPGTSDGLAKFGILCGMVFPLLMFPASILFGLAELLIPELARCRAAGSQRRISYLAAKTIRIGILYGCFWGGFLYMLSGPLCTALFHNAQAGTYLRKYSLLAPMLYTDALTDAMTKGLGQQRACVRYNIITSALDLILLYALLPRYGMAGYGFSFAICHLLNFLLSIRRLLMLTGPVLSLWRIVRIGGSFGTALLLAGTISAPLPAAIIFAILFCCLLTLFGITGTADLQWIRSLIYKK